MRARVCVSVGVNRAFRKQQQDLLAELAGKGEAAQANRQQQQQHTVPYESVPTAVWRHHLQSGGVLVRSLDIVFNNTGLYANRQVRFTHIHT